MRSRDGRVGERAEDQPAVGLCIYVQGAQLMRDNGTHVNVQRNER